MRLTFVSGTITKLNESADYIISGNKRGSDVLGLFNIHNSDGTLNFRDGLLLAEAMKYTIEKLSSKRKTRFKYKIVDLKGENRNTVNLLTTFKNLRFTAIISATEIHQTYFAALLYSGDTYNIPIYSALASSSYFEDAKKSGKAVNVFQFLPNEKKETKAIIDILLKLNWLYVSVVSYADSFMQRFVESFLSLAQRNFICIATRITLPTGIDVQVSSEQLNNLHQYSRAKVIVLFTPPHITNKILNAFGNHTDLHFISGTNWRTTLSTVRGALSVATGSIILQFRNTEDEEFNNHFMNLTLRNYTNNWWFEQFWEETFNCQATATATTNLTKPNCTFDESLEGRIKLKHSLVRPIINAVESIACMVNCIGRHKCHWCRYKIDRFYKCITAYFREYYNKCKCDSYSSLLNSKSAKEKPNVDSFDILNFNGEDYVTVGLWQFNRTSSVSFLDMNVSTIKWKRDKKPESSCYQPCLVGEIEKRDPKGHTCCYECVKCKANEITSNGTCLPCPLHSTPNRKRDICSPLPRRFFDDKIELATLLKFGSFFGIALNTVVTVILAKYWETKIVKATGRELIVAILIALYMCFSSPLVFLIRPSLLVCGIQRFILGLCLTACYTPLMLKTIRIHRIFTASQKMSLRPSFVSTKSQIILCLGFFSVQLLLGVVWIVGNTPEIAFYDINNRSETAVVCKVESVSIVFNLIPCLILMIACTFYGFKTRNFPSNFNEAYSISLTMYITCFLWGIFIPMLFLLETNSAQVFNYVFLIACFMIFIGFVTQFGLFAAKIIKVCNWQRMESSNKQSQFFYSRNIARRESVTTRCSQSTVMDSPRFLNEPHAKARKDNHSFGRYLPFDDKKPEGLRSRYRRAETIKRSGSI